MTEPTVTISLNEYENLKDEIKKKDEEWHQCVIEGKIKTEIVERILFSERLWLVQVKGWGRSVGDWCNDKRILTSEELWKLQSKELKSAIKAIYEKQVEWKGFFDK